MKRHYAAWNPMVRDWAPACGKQGEVQVQQLKDCNCEDCHDAVKAKEVIAHSKRKVVMCWACDGTGVVLGAGPDRGNPMCSRCSGSGLLNSV